jgi:hypothetical protein
MAFKFMCSYLIQAIRDPDTSDELRKHDQEQLDNIRKQLKGPDIKRVDNFVANFKPLPYWFCPEFVSPGRIFKDAIPRLFVCIGSSLGRRMVRLSAQCFSPIRRIRLA